MEKFTLINKDRSRIKVFELFEDVSKPSPSIDVMMISYGGVYSWLTQEGWESYLYGELYAGALANNPNFVNLSDKGFAVLEGPSKITHMK